MCHNWIVNLYCGLVLSKNFEILVLCRRKIMVMQWVAKLLYPKLLSLAMRLGAWQFGKVKTRKHALLSRRWMYKYAWAPTIVKFRGSKTKLDDPLIPFIYTNQVCCLEDGSVRALIGQIHQNISNSNVFDALASLQALQTMLGLNDNLN